MGYNLPGWRNLFYGKHDKRRFKNLLFLFLLFSPFHILLAQNNVVKGRVTSGDTALANITVQVKGTTNSTQTNNSGNYTISAPSNGTLVFTAIGYSRQEESINNRATINVQLQSTAAQLEQVVVVGYGTQRRKDVTGRCKFCNSRTN